MNEYTAPLEGEVQYSPAEKILNVAEAMGVSLEVVVSGGRIDDDNVNVKWVCSDETGADFDVLTINCNKIEGATSKRKAVRQAVEMAMSVYNGNDLQPIIRKCAGGALMNHLEKKYQDGMGDYKQSHPTTALAVSEQEQAMAAEARQLTIDFGRVKLDLAQSMEPVEFLMYVDRQVVKWVGEDNMPKDPKERAKLAGEIALMARQLQTGMDAGEAQSAKFEAEKAVYEAMRRYLNRGALGFTLGHHVATNVDRMLTVASVQVTQGMLTDENMAKAALMVQIAEAATKADVERAALKAKVDAASRREAAEHVAQLYQSRGEAVGNLTREVLTGTGEGISAGFTKIIGEKKGDSYSGLAGGVFVTLEMMSRGLGKIIGQPLDEFFKAVAARRGEIATGTLFTAAGLMVGVGIGLEGGLILIPGAIGMALALLAIAAYQKRFGGSDSSGRGGRGDFR